MICDNCRKESATVFVTKMVNNKTTKLRLCSECARQRALGEGWIEGLSGEDAAQFDDLPLEEIVMRLFAATDDEPKNQDEEQEEWSLSELAALDAAGFQSGEFSGDEDAVDAWDEGDEAIFGDEDPGQSLQEFIANEGAAPLPSLEDADEPRASRPIEVARCPKCTTSWDRLRQDGRVGCAHCYVAFAAQINEVMERLQSAQQHIGKAPRAAVKRRRRLEHLRARRDHRLAMLQERLKTALDEQKYEEAAKLRDKIKIVESTIVAKDEG